MAGNRNDGRPVTISDLQTLKDQGQRFAMVTAYDAYSAALLDQAGVPVILVGDSLGMVVLGHDSTVAVTIDDILHHTRAVRRGTRRALVVADMPFMSYQADLSEGMRNAGRLLQHGGANAVKLEGGGRTVELTARLVEAGIPVMAHLGLTPQSVNQFGGFKVQGRDEHAASQLIDDALALAGAGVFAIVLECVPAKLGTRVTEAVGVPTIGIGAGGGTDGQVLVLHDLLGMSQGHLPRFVKQYADLHAEATRAVHAFADEVASGAYPGPEHGY